MSIQFILLLAVLSSLLLASCSTHRVTTAPEAGAEENVLRYVNHYRVMKGLARLRVDPRITAECRRQCQQMAAKGEISHRGFSDRSFKLRNNFPHAYVAENIGVNYGFHDPSGKITNGWISSNEHRENIEGSYNLTGVGVVKTNEGKYYFSQIFVEFRQPGKSDK